MFDKVVKSTVPGQVIEQIKELLVKGELKRGDRLPGELDDKFKNLKAGYTFMFGHPGKKLLFMGQDFGQLREWSEARELDWYLLGEENHQKLQQYVSDLLHI